MGAFKDLTGERFGKITIMERAPNKGRKTMWEYVCDCGKTGVSSAGDISAGRVLSCGCYNREIITKHGQSHSRLYQIYHDMIARCYNGNSKAYRAYGARGICVCAEWLEDFQSFSEWAMLNGYSDALTIDRIDNNKGYSPENCRWATNKEQANNTRRNVYVEACNQCLTYAQWAAILGVSRWNVQKGTRKHGAAYIERKLSQNGCHPIEVTGESRRKEKGRKDYATMRDILGL